VQQLGSFLGGEPLLGRCRCCVTVSDWWTCNFIIKRGEQRLARDRHGGPGRQELGGAAKICQREH
jgi:hypothetical protein